MPTHEIISYLAASDTRFETLQALAQESASQTELNTRCSGSVSTLYRHLDEFEKRGWVFRSDDRYLVSPLGKAIVHVCEESMIFSQAKTEIITQEMCAFLADSSHAIPILRDLRDRKRPIQRSQLDGQYGSPQTIQRVLDKFCDEGFVVQKRNHYKLKKTGKSALDIYDKVDVRIEQLYKKKTFFQRIGKSGISVPIDVIDGLDEAAMWNSSPQRPFESLRGFLEYASPEIDHLRVLCPIFAPILFDGYFSFVEEGMAAEFIPDQPTYEDIRRNPETQHLLHRTDLNHYQFLLFPDKITFGIVLYDDSQAAIGTFRQGKQKPISLLVSDEPRFVGWATDIYTTYRDKARPIEDA